MILVSRMTGLRPSPAIPCLTPKRGPLQILVKEFPLETIP